MSWFNKRMAKKIRGKGGKAMGLDPLLLITIGSKSGQVRDARRPFPRPGRLLVRGRVRQWGSAQPSLVLQRRRTPEQVRIVIDGVESAVTAEQLHDAAREHAWQQICAAQPRFAKYATKTDRLIPVVKLTPRIE